MSYLKVSNAAIANPELYVAYHINSETFHHMTRKTCHIKSEIFFCAWDFSELSDKISGNILMIKQKCHLKMKVLKIQNIAIMKKMYTNNGHSLSKSIF